MLHSEPSRPEYLNPPDEEPTLKRCSCGNIDPSQFCKVSDALVEAYAGDPILKENPNWWICIMCGAIKEDFELIYEDDQY